MRLLSFPPLKAEKGIPYVRRHIRDLVAAGQFPAPVALSDARIAWVESEVDAWLAAKLAARDAAAALKSEPVAVPVPVALNNASDEQRRPQRPVRLHRASRVGPVARSTAEEAADVERS